MAAKQKVNAEANFVAYHAKCAIPRDVALTPSEVTGTPDAILRAMQAQANQ